MRQGQPRRPKGTRGAGQFAPGKLPRPPDASAAADAFDKLVDRACADPPRWEDSRRSGGPGKYLAKRCRARFGPLSVNEAPFSLVVVHRFNTGWEVSIFTDSYDGEPILVDLGGDEVKCFDNYLRVGPSAQLGCWQTAEAALEGVTALLEGAAPADDYAFSEDPLSSAGQARGGQ